MTINLEDPDLFNRIAGDFIVPGRSRSLAPRRPARMSASIACGKDRFPGAWTGMHADILSRLPKGLKCDSRSKTQCARLRLKVRPVRLTSMQELGAFAM
jgi:hypothetical protein